MPIDRGALRGKTPRITWGASFANSLVFALWLDTALAYDRALETSEAEGYAGARDVVQLSQRGLLAGTVRRIPRVTTGGITGWEGATGWQAWLKTAHDLQPFRWIPDQAALGTYWLAYLVEPMNGRCDEEPNRFRMLPLVIERADGTPVVGY